MMNREIKFRAWDNITNTMVYFDLPDVQRNLFSIRELVFREGSNNPIMQYIGFHDKKGVGVYEGDLLSHPRNRGDGCVPVISEIYWDNKRIGWMARSFINYFDKDNRSEMPPPFPLQSYNYHNIWEVIGNIYERVKSE